MDYIKKSGTHKLEKFNPKYTFQFEHLKPSESHKNGRISMERRPSDVICGVV